MTTHYLRPATHAPRLYHRDIGLPAQMREFTGQFTLQYSAHAVRAALEDRYGVIRLPRTLRIDQRNIVEVELDAHGSPLKAVVRVPYNDCCDLVLVLQPPAWAQTFVRTVWLNRVADTHATLDASRYCRA